MHQENEAWWNFSSIFTEYAIDGDERWPMELKVLTFGQLDTFDFLYERTHSRTETKRSPKSDICKMSNAPLQLKFHKFSVEACPLAYDCLHPHPHFRTRSAAPAVCLLPTPVPPSDERHGAGGQHHQQASYDGQRAGTSVKKRVIKQVREHDVDVSHEGHGCGVFQLKAAVQAHAPQHSANGWNGTADEPQEKTSSYDPWQTAGT